MKPQISLKAVASYEKLYSHDCDSPVIPATRKLCRHITDKLDTGLHMKH